MKIKSLAMILSFLLFIGCLCGCDTVTDFSDNDASFSDTGITDNIDDSDSIITTTTKKVTTTTKFTTTTKKKTTTTAKTVVTKAPQSKPTQEMVWIPTNGGTKYHKTSSCSKMIDPKHVTLEEAKRLGFTACKRKGCYG